MSLVKSWALALSGCVLLVACGGGAPSDDEVVETVKAHVVKTKALMVKSVKSLGCTKTKEGEIKQPGVFYGCRVELDVPGYAQGKATAYLQQVEGKWSVLGIE